MPLLSILLLLIGGVCLYYGAEWLVRGSAGLALAFGVSSVVVGLTVVSFGTSAPELVVSTLAAIGDKPAIALGNVVGSNIANIGLILGLTALIAPPIAEGSLRTRELPILLIATGAVPLVLIDGAIGRLDATIFLLGAIAFTYATLRWTEREPKSLAEPDSQATKPETLGKWALGGLVVVGLVVLFVGGKAFVEGAVGVATWVGVSDRVVGLTVVALGTSLPELAASLVAAVRGHSELAVGNVVGSNILNILLIFGVAGLVRPIPGTLSESALDMALMGLLTVGCAVAIRRERRVTRLEGAVLLAGYFAFIGMLAQQSLC
jgi:cation:H+ antiporter